MGEHLPRTEHPSDMSASAGTKLRTQLEMIISISIRIMLPPSNTYRERVLEYLDLPYVVIESFVTQKGQVVN